MTDTVTIGQFTVDKQATDQNQPLWTWTMGQFRADRHLYSTETMRTDKEEKRKSPCFAFLKISASTLHTFAKPHVPIHNPNFPKECNFPPLNILVIL